MFDQPKPRKVRTAWEIEQEQRYNDEFRARWDALMAQDDSKLPAWAVQIKRNRERRIGNAGNEGR